MKTKEELNALKEKEVEAESKEPRKLTEEELVEVTGGILGINNDSESIELEGGKIIVKAMSCLGDPPSE